MSKLSSLIEVLENNTKMHVCVHDVSGILCFDDLKLEYSNKIHLTSYCNAAKATKQGYDLCITCKNLANSKAINTKKPFCGYCPYGLFEAVHPVCIGERVLCIVYVGNALLDKTIQKNRLLKIEKIVNLNLPTMEQASETCEAKTTKEMMTNTAFVIAEFIKLIAEKNKLCQSTGFRSAKRPVRDICDYIEINYNQKLTLKSLSKLYFINEKYLGRIFKLQTGLNFNDYLNELRLEKALNKILSDNCSIIEAALDCGYSSVNYFNRLFFKKYHCTPSKMRQQYLKHN